MNLIPLYTLYNTDYTISDITAIKQTTQQLSDFSCMGIPKQKSMLLFTDGCKGTYVMKNGEILNADCSDIVYVPPGSQYSVHFEAISSESCTIGVNFVISDEIYLADKISIIRADNVNYKSLFYKIALAGESAPPVPGKLKACLYEILNSLCEFKRKTRAGKYDVITKAIEYLETDTRMDMSVKEIADMCNISEAHFRKLFKSYAGMSPNEYIINAKMCKARQYLDYNIPVGEISELLGFRDVSYFIKLFREKNGCTPLAYKNK